ncbi:MAG: AAA family ATPase [Verrucomicrobia bacterium]|nr:AAA family ATPase [Verrucomicrobiota bacterium]
MKHDSTEYIPREGEFDPLRQEAPGVPLKAISPEDPSQPLTTASGKVPPRIQFYSLGELQAYSPPKDQCLLGDYHLQRGAMTVLAGPPGCGKSRAALSLAIKGARGEGTFLGLALHGAFKTLIVQNENGMTRLHRDVSQIGDVSSLGDSIRISAPPPLGMALQNPNFLEDLKAAIREFNPDLIIVDPLNACLRDSMEKDLQEVFSKIREIAAESNKQPAVLLLHHLRKPKSDDSHRGRNLAHLLAGSYVLVSVARCVFVMQPASDDTEDNRVVVTCAKNNDGGMGPRTAWTREAGLEFLPVAGFSWEAFDKGSSKREAKVQEHHIREVFEDGRSWLTQKEAASHLMEMAGIGRSAAYDALKVVEGRFSQMLTRRGDGTIGLRFTGPTTIEAG